MNLWITMIHLSSTGRTWHLELKTRWSICFWSAHRRRGGCVWYDHLLVWHTPIGSLLCRRSPLVMQGRTLRGKKIPSQQRETLCRMMNKFYNPTVLLHALEMNIFKAERSCHPATEAALRIHSHYQTFFSLQFSTFIISKRQSSSRIGEAHNTALNRIICSALLCCRCRWVGSTTSRLGFQFEHQWVWGSYRIPEQPKLNANFVSHFSWGNTRQPYFPIQSVSHKILSIITEYNGRFIF